MKIHLTKILLIALITILGLTACGKTNQQNQTTTNETQIQNIDAEPTEGGSLILGITQEPDSFDPYLAAAAGTKEIIYNFFDGLMKLMPDSTFEPALAEKFEVSEDGKEYTFVIRQNVKFHNDKELTEEDVVYSIKQAAGLGEDRTTKIAPLANVSDVIANQENHTVNISLKEPDADFISYMTMAIVPSDYNEQATKPIGTGPFKFTEYKKQQYVKMAKNENYWRERNAYLDEVTFQIMPSADAAIVDLQAGTIDIFPYLTMDKMDLLKDKYNFIEADSNMVQLWALNNARAPFDNPKVRQALNMAIDKQMIIDTVTFGVGKVLESGMAPTMGDYYQANLQSHYNPEEARKILDEVGLQDLAVNITVPGNYVIHVQTAEVIAAQLEAINVKTDIQSVDWGTWLTEVYQGKNFDSTVIALTFDYVAPATVLKHYRSGNDSDFINYSNPQFDELYEKATRITNPAERVPLYHEMQNILQEDAASVFLQNPGVQTAVKKNIGGYTTYPQYVQDMYEVYFIAE